MTLRYQTGTATLVQLIIMLLMNFVNGVSSSVSACTSHSDCISNIVTTALFLIVLAVWLIFLSMLGYTAEDKRSHAIARVLIAGEALVALVTLFDIKHYPNILGLITSIVDFTLAVWVITLAYRLSKAKGGRITSSGRKRTTTH